MKAQEFLKIITIVDDRYGILVSKFSYFLRYLIFKKISTPNLSVCRLLCPVVTHTYIFPMGLLLASLVIDPNGPAAPRNRLRRFLGPSTTPRTPGELVDNVDVSLRYIVDDRYGILVSKFSYFLRYLIFKKISTPNLSVCRLL